MGIADIGNPFRFPLPLSAGMGGRVCPYRVSIIVFCIIRFLFYIPVFVGRSIGGCVCAMDPSFSDSAKKKK